MEGTWPSGTYTIDRIQAVRTLFFLHLATSSLALSVEDPRVPSEVLDTRTVLVLQWMHTSMRAPLEQVPSTLRHSRDKFYQAPSFSCMQHWKIERSLGTRLAIPYEKWRSYESLNGDRYTYSKKRKILMSHFWEAIQAMNVKLFWITTLFIRIVAAATINFALSFVRL